MTSRLDPPTQPGDQTGNPQRHNRYNRRDGHTHSHVHSHAKLHHTHNRLHSPSNLDHKDDELVARVADGTPKQHPADDQDHPAAAYHTHVIQTLSLIYGTDAEGNPSIHTIVGPPATVVVDSQSGETIAAISAQDVTSTPSAPASEPAASEAPLSDASVTASAPITTSLTPQVPTDVDTPAPVTDSSSTSAESTEQMISAPLPSPSAASIGHHVGNATNTPLSVGSSIHSNTNTTMLKAFDFTSTSFTPTTTTSRSTISSHTTLSSFFSSSTSDSPTSTAVLGEGGNLPGGDEDQAQPTAGSDTNDEALTPREKQIVGGVVGGVAGAAFFLLLIMLALRYKKRKQAHLALEDNDGSGASRGIAGGPGPAGPAMSQRSSMPAAVAAAMASLTGNRKPPPQPAPPSEQGFYRVSGRKLQSVLQTGGDGYSDPHASVASGGSDYHRGSQAFERGEGPSSHLTLGSPMRPVSGVMVMRDGPARTPVTAQNPFADPPSPPPSRGPGTLGRSLASYDGSGASGSRFREGI